MQTGALNRSMKFFSPEVALYLYKSTIQPCIEYCCHVWAGAPSCYLKLLDKLQKRICRAVGPSFPASLQPLAHSRNIASLSLFYRCSSDVRLNWLNQFHFLIFNGSLLVNVIDCMTFPYTAKLQNSLPIECFTLSYDLNDFKSRINKHLLSLGYFCVSQWLGYFSLVWRDNIYLTREIHMFE